MQPIGARACGPAAFGLFRPGRPAGQASRSVRAPPATDAVFNGSTQHPRIHNRFYAHVGRSRDIRGIAMTAQIITFRTRGNFEADEFWMASLELQFAFATLAADLADIIAEQFTKPKEPAA